MVSRRFGLACLATLTLHVWATSASARDTLVIGSKNFTENRLLAEIMAQLLETRTGLEVERRTNLAGTLLAHSALESGEIDIYPEYTGTGWSVVLGRQAAISDPLRTYLVVAEEYEKRFGIRWLQPFGFSNSYGVAILDSTADRLGIERISDLQAHQSELTVAWSHEFLNREDGYPGLKAAYDLELADVRGMEHGLAYEAIRSGTVDLTDAYTTDGKLLRFPVRVLEDDRDFFPPYDCAPVVRVEALEQHPELAEALAELAFRLPADQMQRLNFQVEEEGRSFDAVATAFLRQEGLLERSTHDGQQDRAPTRGAGFLSFFWHRMPETLERVVEHLILTGAATMLAILAAVPLGVLLSRRRRLVAPFLGASGVIQTIPSLALLAFMIPIPWLGLGARSAIAALFLYAILPILRNTYAGIREVDPETVEAAVGMGLTDAQVLRLVELPLAARTIMAGIRTATVISIGVATLAAFIGAGGLGEPIVTGLQLNDTRLILSGAIPAAALALLADWLMGRIEEVVTPAA
ncbi:MAG: ABC transporter permease subunit [Thermoanaerobaculia bacterium]|nr:ABC transporter permease subunit [Thermoanaerobaculia bacterium]